MRHRRRRIDHRAGPAAVLANQSQRAIQVRRGFLVHRNHVRPGLGKRPDVLLRILDHQMHVQGHPGCLAQGRHHRHADRNIRHEVAVHHVHVQHAMRHRARPRRWRRPERQSPRPGWTGRFRRESAHSLRQGFYHSVLFAQSFLAANSRVSQAGNALRESGMGGSVRKAGLADASGKERPALTGRH